MNKTSAVLVRSILLGTSCLSVVAGLPAHANPTGGKVVQGQGTITNNGNTSTVIDQKTGRLIINWDSFSIDAGSTVQFIQPNGKSIALNRVTGADPSAIYGNLFANGNVWIINGNGVMFGKGAQINVGGLIATTADIRDGDFMAGNYAFSGGTGAAVSNQGTIHAKNGGVVLSGASASNSGLIAAQTGTVVIGGAKAFTVDFQGDGLIKYAVTQAAGPADNGKTGASNSGTIQGQRVIMTARAASGVQDAVVNNTGMIEATSAKVGQNGEVILDGGDGDVNVAGTVDASGTAPGTKGGSITVTGRDITVADGTTINASGQAGGGTIKIGGDLHGNGPTEKAQNVHIGQATITADAGTKGDGGEIVVWSTGETDFAGIVSAKGGTQSGNGGTVETSGHTLHVGTTASVNTQAPHGKTGNWLLDPDTLIISDSGSDTLTGGTDPLSNNPSGTDTIAPSTIIAALGTTNVTLEATTLLEVDSDVVYASGHDLNLLSEGGINVNATVENTLSSGGGAINLIAGWDGTTTDFTSLTLASTAFGANNARINFGSNGFTSIVGDASGTVTVAGYDIRLQSQSNDVISQIGYHGAGGGDINVLAENGVSLFAGEGNANTLAMIGNGDKLGTVSGAVTGDISIASGNVTGIQVFTGGTVWVGNSSTGGETGNLNLTGSFVDNSCCGFEGGGSIDPMIAAALNGGDVTWKSSSSIDIDHAIAWSSTHSLTLLSSQDIDVTASIDNSLATGGGAITLVAGWDGVTTALPDLAMGTAFGNNSGAINISSDTTGVMVGAASGTLTLAADAVSVTAGAAYAQAGYHGAGGGDIDILTKDAMQLSASFATAMVGNGSRDGDVDGDITGNLNVSVGGAFSMNQDRSTAPVWFGNSGTSNVSGNATLVVGAQGESNVDLFSNIAADLANGDFTLGFLLSGSVVNPVEYDSAHTFTVLAENSLDILAPIVNDGTGAINLVAGWDGATTDINQIAINGDYGNEGGFLTIGGTDASGDVFVGSAGGRTTVLAEELDVDAENGNAQLGYHGAGGGDIAIATAGDINVTGGDPSDLGPYAMIGNGALDGSVTGNVSGNISINAGGTFSLSTNFDDEVCLECVVPTTVGIGNTTGSGTATGAVLMLAGDFEDSNSDSARFGDIIAGDLVGGDVTMGMTDSENDFTINSDIDYTSAHNLTLLSKGRLFVDSSIQNAGSGGITLVGGWDGTTLDPDLLGTAGTYASPGVYGDITIQGGEGGPANVGSAGGPVHIYGSSLSVEAINNEAQLGYIGNGGGDIFVNVTSDVTVSAGSNSNAMIGNGSFDDGVVTGNVTGNIDIRAGGNVEFDNYNDGPGGVAWLGNVAPGFLETGDVTVVASTGSLGGFISTDLGDNNGNGGDVFVGFTDTADGAFSVGGVNVNTPHSFTWAVADDLNITGSLINNGTGAITLVAGWDGTTVGGAAALTAAGAYGLDSHTVTIGDANQSDNISVGSAGGTTTVLTANLTLQSNNGFYDQLGYHGMGGGDIAVLAQGGVELFAGNAQAAYAMIGNGTMLNDFGGSVTGDIDIHSGGNMRIVDGDGGTAWIGNIDVETGLETGNVHIVTYDIATGDQLGSMLMQDAQGGDVVVEVQNAASSITLSDNVTVTAAHDLTFLTAGSLTIAGEMDNNGAGNITLLAGWDGQTTDAAHFGDAGVFGSNDGSITIGGANASGATGIGTKGGTLNVYTGALNIEGTDFDAHLGYGAGGATGAINVDATGAISLTSQGGALAFIGNGTTVTTADAGPVTITASTITQFGQGGIAATDLSLTTTADGIGDVEDLVDIAANNLTLSSAGDVYLNVLGGINIVSADLNGQTLLLNTAGAVTQTGAIDASELEVFTTGSTGTVTLTDAGNSFGTVNVSTEDADASFFTTADLTVSGADVGSGTLSLTGATMSQTSSINAGALIADATSGGILLDDDTNSIGALSVSTAAGQNANVHDGAALTVTSANVGGALTLASASTIGEEGSITAGGLDVTAGGAVTLDSVNSVSGDVIFTTSNNANVTFDNGVATNIFSAALGTGTLALESGGAVTQTGAITAGTLNVGTTSGAITLDNAGNSFTGLALHTAGTDNASVTDSTGVALGASNVGGTLTLHAGGAVSQTGAIIATALNLNTTAGNIDLTDSGNSFGSLAVSTGAAGAADIVDSTGVDIASADVGGLLTLSAGGAVTQSGIITAGGLDVTTSSGSILLNKANDVSGTVALHAQNNATFDSAGAIDLGASSAGISINLTATGDITQSGALSTFSLRATSTGGDITLTNSANHFVTLAASTLGSNDASFVSDSAVAIDATSVGGLFSLGAGGAVTQVGSPGIGITAGSADISTSSGNITLTSASNAISGLISLSTPSGAVTLDNTLATVLGTGSASGAFTVTSGGGITQGGAITAASLDVSTTGGSGSIMLTDADNSFGALTFHTVFAADVLVSDSSGFTLGDSSGGFVTLNSGGAINENGALNAVALLATSTGGAITLDGDNRIGGGVSLNTSGRFDATFADIIGFNVAASNVGGTLNLSVGADDVFGGITQSGAITAAALNVSTTGTDNFVLEDLGNKITGAISMTTGGSATVLNSLDTVIGTSNVTGTLTVTSDKGITQNGAITAGTLAVDATGLSTLSSGGAVVLTDANNKIGKLGVGSAAGFNATVVDSTAVILQGGSIGGTFTLTAGGAISAVTDTFLTADALDLSASGQSITLDNAHLGVASLTVSNASDVTIVDGSALSITSAAITGTLNLTAGGAITQTGAITAAALDLTAQGGAITLTNAGNAFGILTAATDSGFATTVADTGDLTVGTSTIGGKLTLSSTGTIDATGAIHSAGLSASTTSGDLDFSNTDNAITGTATFQTPGTVSFTNGVATDIGASHGGTGFSVHSAGNITQSGAITTTALVVTATGASTATLTNAGNVFSSLGINAGAASIVDSTGLSLHGGSVTGALSLKAGGAVTQTTGLTAGSLDLTTTTGAIALTDSDNSIAQVAFHTASGFDATYVSGFFPGTLTLATSSVGGKLTVDSQGAIASSGIITAHDLDVTASNNGIDLTTAIAGTIAVHAAGGSATIHNTGAAQLAASNAFGTLTLTATGGIAITGATSAGVLDLSAAGPITQTAAITANALDITSTAGAVTLTDAGNAFGSLDVTMGDGSAASFTDTANSLNIAGIDMTGALTLSDANGSITQTGAITAGSLALTGAATLTNTGNHVGTFSATEAGGGNVSYAQSGALVLGASNVGGTLTVNAGGAITQSGAITAQTLNATAGGTGSVTLTNSGNAIQNLDVIATGGSATVIDSTGLAVGGANVGGTFTLTAGGAITQTGAIDAQSLNVSASSGAITLTDFSNDFGALTVSTTGGSNAAIVDGAALAVASANVGGTLNLRTSGALTQAGAIHAASLVANAGAGGITLTNAGNSFGTLTLTTSGGGNATVDDTTGVLLGGSTVGGTLTLNAGGAVTQSGAITANALSVSTTGGDIDLTDIGNSVSGAIVLSTAGDASYWTAHAIDLGAADVGGTLTLVASGSIGQSAAFTAGALDVTAGNPGSTITLGNSANNIGTVSVSTNGGSALINSARSLVIAAVDAGTDSVSFGSGGSVTQSGAITAGTLNVSAGGAITLTSKGNAFGALSLTTTGSNGATVTDSTAVSLGATNVGGLLTLNAGGSVSQTAALSAGSLSVSVTLGNGETPKGGSFAQDSQQNPGNITLTDAGNSVSGPVALSAPGNAAFTNTQATQMAASNVGGTTTIVSAGDVTQTGPIITGVLDVTSTGGSVTLDNADNVFSELGLASAGDSSITDSTGVTITSANTAGFTLRAGGAIAQTGAILSTSFDVATTSGDITLDSVHNVFGPLTASGSGDGTFDVSGRLIVASADFDGTLSLGATDGIGQTGAIQADTLNLNTGGPVILTDTDNDFAMLNVSTGGANNATIQDSPGVTVTGADVGGLLILTAGGDVTQSGAITAGGLVVTSRTGTIALTDEGNEFGTLSVFTGGNNDATVTDAGGVTLSTSTVGGRFRLNAGGTIDQSGALRARGANLSTSEGDIELTDTDNAVVGTVFFDTPGSVAFYDTGNATVGDSSFGGDFSVLATGNVDIVGRVQAGTGNVTVVAGWDGSTVAAADFGDSGVYGNNNGSVLIGGATTSAAYLGSQSGVTAVYADDVNVEGTHAAAQLGYHGAGGGDIQVTALGNLRVLGGTGNALLGNGSLGTDIEGAVTGDIDVQVAGGAFFSDGAQTMGWIGNVSPDGETGNLTLVAARVGTPTEQRFDDMVVAAIVGGDVTLGFTNTDVTTHLDVAYDSSHTLSLLDTGAITVAGSIQNSGTGAINLVGGWDGATLDASAFGNAGVYGNNGNGVTIGGSDAVGGVAVGSAGGTTSIYGANLLLDASRGYAQLGFNGHGDGAIVVGTTGDVTLSGGSGTGDFAQIGNGGLNTSGSNHGDIAITAGGDVIVTGGVGSEAYAQIGHGGAESNTNSEGYENVADIDISATNVTLTASAGSTGYAMIGNGGYKSGQGLTGTARNSGDITVAVTHAVTLQGGGNDGFVQIGNGGSQSNLNAGAQATGDDSGTIRVTAPNGENGSVTLTAGAGDNAYAQIGNGGYSVNVGALAVPANFTIGGDVHVTDLTLLGGGTNGYAQIGNGDASQTSYGNVSGNIFIDANGNITYTNGPGSHALATIGNFTGQGTVSGEIEGASPPGEGGGSVITDPGTIGVIVTSTPGDPNGPPPITTIDTTTIPVPQDEGTGATSLTVYIDNGPPGPLASLEDGQDNEEPTTADSATVVIADSLDGTNQPSSTLVIVPGILTQTLPGGGTTVHPVPPADQDFSSWGNEALWQ